MRPSPRPIVVRSVPDLSFDLVQSLHTRASRDARGLFLAEGARFLSSAIEYGAVFAGMVVCPYRIPSTHARELITRLERAGVPRLRASPEEYRALSTGRSEAGENTAAGQGVMLVLHQRWQTLPDRAQPDDLWIGVESVRNPGNIGTLLRSGDAAGATGPIVFDRSEAGSPAGVDPHDPAAVRATMGSIFAHRMIRTTHRAFRRASGRSELLVLGGTPEATDDYRTPDYRRPTVVMLGDERKGLSDGQRATCDGFVRIPMVGAPDSLNLSMAGTLILYEVLNQRRPLRH